MTDARLSEMGIRLAAELRDALDDPKRYEWGDGPWEHLGDAEKDVRLLLATVDELVDERDALFEALSGIPLSQPANVVMPERTLELVLDIVDRGVCEGTTPVEALSTIGHLIRKRHPRKTCR